MPRFFVEDICGEDFIITGENARHMAKSLRMRAGEMITVSDGRGMDYGCEITEVKDTGVHVKILYHQPSNVEASIKVTLYQGLPKGDKMDYIVQKAVELGVCKIVPVLTERSVSRPDARSAAKKQERWQKIAGEAAKQSGRGKIPVVESVIPFNKIKWEDCEPLKVLFYEGGGVPMQNAMENYPDQIGLFIGPEGGWEKSEVTVLESAGAKIATLGPRILRTETAPLAALSVIMFLTGNLG